LENLYTYKDTTLAASFKDADMKKGIVTGYFSRFGNVDSDGDIIKAGAFTKTVKEQGPNSAQPRIKHLMNHNPSMPLGKLLSLKEDSTGLVYESQVGSHALGQDFIKMVESGLITEHSIGYKTIKRNQLQDYSGYQRNPSKGMFEITEAKLFEGSSLTSWGANPLTPLTGLKGDAAQLKQIDLLNIITQQIAIEKFCKDSTATDETIEMLLLHSKQLSQYILDIKVNQPAKATDPNKWQGWVTKLKTT
jgi:HK97 family phage prohead protease